jgi:hypothetical protein
VNNGGNCVWESTTKTGRTNYAGGNGYAAVADSDWCDYGTVLDTAIQTPPLDLSASVRARLEFVASYNDLKSDGSDAFKVDVSTDGGGSWSNLLSWNEDHSAYGPGEKVQLDLGAYAGLNKVIIRFYYVSPDWSWWAMIDEVYVRACVQEIGPMSTPTPPPTHTPAPTPKAEIMINESSFGPGNQLTSTFLLHESIGRPFTVFAVIILPNNTMLNALTLSPKIQPVATKVPGLAAGFTRQLLSVKVPPGAPTGEYELVVAFFDPNTKITGRGDAFLDVNARFSIRQ